jgi:hypothetical protein
MLLATLLNLPESALTLTEGERGTRILRIIAEIDPPAFVKALQQAYPNDHHGIKTIPGGVEVRLIPTMPAAANG